MASEACNARLRSTGGGGGGFFPLNVGFASMPNSCWYWMHQHPNVSDQKVGIRCQLPSSHNHNGESGWDEEKTNRNANNAAISKINDTGNLANPPHHPTQRKLLAACKASHNFQTSRGAHAKKTA